MSNKNSADPNSLVPPFYGDDIFTYQDFPLRVEREQQLSFVPQHAHSAYEIVMVAKGSAVHVIQQEEKELSYGIIQGDIFAVLPHEYHAYKASGDLVIYNVIMKPELLGDEWETLSALQSWGNLFERKNKQVREKVHLSAQKRESAELHLDKIIHEFFWRESGFMLSAKTALVEFLITVLRGEATAWQALTPGLNGILKTICRMESAPEKHYTLSMLASEASMSVPSYTNKFREATGISPTEYLIRIRIEKVKEMLNKHDLNISEIAYQCGFCSTNYMIRLFSSRMGLTPSQYRKIVSGNIIKSDLPKYKIK